MADESDLSEKLTQCKPGTEDPDCLGPVAKQTPSKPAVRNNSRDRPRTNQVPRRPPLGVIRTATKTRRPFTAFNNLNIPIKSPRRFKDRKFKKNRNRTVTTTKPNKVTSSKGDKSKKTKTIVNKNKSRKPKKFLDDAGTDTDDADGQFDNDEDFDDHEPAAAPEPEPSGHHGDPRHHAFHSCQYID